MTDSSEMQETFITLTADIVAAHVSNNSVAVNDLPTLISNVHTALASLGTPKLLRYFATLTTGRIVLWCYAIWYLANVAQHFESRPRLWLTSLGLSAIIGARE